MIMLRPCWLGVFAALAVCSLPSTAEAMPCAASTPVQLTTADGAADESDARGNPDPARTAPDISSVDVSADAQCQLTFGVTLGDHATSPGALLAGHRIRMWLDTDGDPATGDVDGADVLVMSSTLRNGIDHSAIWVWIGNQFYLRRTLSPAAPWARRTLSFAWLGITRPAMLRVYATADTTDALYRDSSASFDVPIQFSGPTPYPRARECRVPSTRGLALRPAIDRLMNAGCPFHALGGNTSGRAFGTKPAAGTSTSGSVALYLSRG
jgi:hypothetical protein